MAVKYQGFSMLFYLNVYYRNKIKPDKGGSGSYFNTAQAQQLRQHLSKYAYAPANQSVYLYF